MSYTPTTEDVRESWCEPRSEAQGIDPDYHYYMVAAFDRWLQAHDAEVAARALDEAADDWGEDGILRMFDDGVTNDETAVLSAVRYLRASAAQKRGA